MTKKYTKIEVKLTKNFYIDPNYTSEFSILEQLKRNVNGWNWNTGKIEVLQVGAVDWQETRNENILDTPIVKA